MFLWLQERVSVIRKIVSFPCVHGNKYFHACTGRNTIYHLQKRIQVGAIPDILQVQERAYIIRKLAFIACAPTGMHSKNFAGVGTRFYHSQIVFIACVPVRTLLIILRV